MVLIVGTRHTKPYLVYHTKIYILVLARRETRVNQYDRGRGDSPKSGQ